MDNIIMSGPPRSGKSRNAELIAKNYKSDEVVEINCRREKRLDRNNFIFTDCTEKTKLIIFEEVRGIDNINYLYSMMNHGIKVNKKHKEPFIIYPLFVIVIQSDLPIETIDKN